MLTSRVLMARRISRWAAEVPPTEYANWSCSLIPVAFERNHKRALRVARVRRERESELVRIVVLDAAPRPVPVAPEQSHVILLVHPRLGAGRRRRKRNFMNARPRDILLAAALGIEHVRQPLIDQRPARTLIETLKHAH